MRNQVWARRRGATVEKVFGTIKWAMGGENLLMKGLEKCRGEWSLMCCCYNMKRAIAILGVEKLLEALEAGLSSRKSSHASHEWLGGCAIVLRRSLGCVSNFLFNNTRRHAIPLAVPAF